MQYGSRNKHNLPTSISALKQLSILYVVNRETVRLIMLTIKTYNNLKSEYWRRMDISNTTLDEYHYIKYHNMFKVRIHRWRMINVHYHFLNTIRDRNTFLWVSFYWEVVAKQAFVKPSHAWPNRCFITGLHFIETIHDILWWSSHLVCVNISTILFIHMYEALKGYRDITNLHCINIS